jgi:hypothetical protein
MNTPENPQGEPFEDADQGSLFEEHFYGTEGADDEEIQSFMFAPDPFILKQLEVFGELEDAGIPRVLDPDGDKEKELFTAFSSSWQLKKLEELVVTREKGPGLSIGRLAQECLTEYYDEREFELLVISSAALLASQLENAQEWDIDVNEVLGGKKEIQALLLVCYGRGYDDEWFKFFDKMVPGTSLTPGNPDDDVFLDRAWDIQAEFEETNTKRLRVMDTLSTLVGLDYETRDIGDVLEDVASVIEMRMIAEFPVFTEHDLGYRNEEILKYAKQLSEDPDVLEQVVALFNEEDPVVDHFGDDNLDEMD